MSLENLRKVPITPEVQATFDAFYALKDLKDANNEPALRHYETPQPQRNPQTGVLRLNYETIDEEYFRLRVKRLGPNIDRSTHRINHESYMLLGKLAVNYSNTVGWHNKATFTADSLTFDHKDRVTILTTHSRGADKLFMADYRDEFDIQSLLLYHTMLKGAYYDITRTLDIDVPTPEAIGSEPAIEGPTPLAKVIPLHPRGQ